MWTKIRDYLIAAFFLSFLLLGVLYGLQRHSLVKARGEAKEAVQQAQEASQALTEARLSFRVDLDAIDKTQKAKEGLVENATKVKEKVDEVAKKVEEGKLSDAAADAQLLDSMWEAYCKGANDPTCSARSPSSRHKG